MVQKWSDIRRAKGAPEAPEGIRLTSTISSCGDCGLRVRVPQLVRKGQPRTFLTLRHRDDGGHDVSEIAK